MSVSLLAVTLARNFGVRGGSVPPGCLLATLNVALQRPAGWQG